MSEIREISLPGVGVRLEFTTEEGDPVAVVVHRGGRRELVVYDRDDPDTCRSVVHLSPDDSHTLSEILGASRVSEVVAEVEQRIEGLAIDWLTVEADSPFVGRSIGEGMFRTRTGVSFVAVVRDRRTIPAPTADFVFAGGDVVVTIGTPAAIDEVRAMVSP